MVDQNGGSGNGAGELKRTMGPAFLFTLAVSTIIGPWLVMTNWWFSLTGVSISLAFVLVGLICIPIGLVYDELTAMFPQVGGSFYFIKKAFGKEASYWVSWCLILSYTAVLAFQLLAFVNIVSYLWFPSLTIQETMLISAALAFGAYFLNTRELIVSASVQFIMTITLAIIGIGYVSLFFISPQYSVENLNPMFSTGLDGFIVAMALMVTMFFGFEVIPQFAEESKYPPKKQWKLITFALVFSVSFYALICLGEGGMASLAYKINTPMLGAELALNSYGPWLQYSIAIASMAALFGCLIGFWLAGSRLMLSMGREKILPPIFAKLNKNHVPKTANLTILAIILMFIVLSGTEWIASLFTLMALGVGVAYTAVSLTFIYFRRRHPGLERAWKVPGGQFTGILAIVGGIVITYFTISYFTAEVWTLCIIYFAIGLVIRTILYFYSKSAPLEDVPPIEIEGTGEIE